MISFSSITDSPKLNLDDVSDWYITNTIIKDPPKGIFSTFRDETSGMVEGFSGRIPISKNDSNWQQHPHMQFKNLQNITIATNANGNVTKDNISRVEKDRERNLPLYSVKTHKIYKGLHVNYLNGKTASYLYYRYDQS